MRQLPVKGAILTTDDVSKEIPLFLTPAEVSKEWGVSIAELRTMRTEMKGPQPIVFTSKTIWYWRIQVLEWKDKHRL